MDIPLLAVGEQIGEASQDRDHSKQSHIWTVTFSSLWPFCENQIADIEWSMNEDAANG